MEAAFVISIMIAIVAVLISYLTIKRVKRQISEMTDILIDVRNGNGNRRILSAPNELVAPLVYVINDIIMSYENRISVFQQTEEANKQLMTSLSHDVRTPLTTLIGYLDAAHKGIVTGKDRDDYIETARRKAHDLKEYIDVLFDWFKLNSNEFVMEMKTVEAAELTRNLRWLRIFLIWIILELSEGGMIICHKQFKHCLLSIYQKYKRFMVHISRALFFTVPMQEVIIHPILMLISCCWWI